MKVYRGYVNAAGTTMTEMKMISLPRSISGIVGQLRIIDVDTTITVTMLGHVVVLGKILI